jgi:prephenate dehydrogenase
MAPPVSFNRLALIGVGLIGGSIARAARALSRRASAFASSALPMR